MDFLNAPGFLGTQATMLKDITLLVEILFFITMCVGVVAQLQKAYKWHDRLQIPVVLLNILFIIFVMMPSFSGVTNNLSDIGQSYIYVPLIHGILGAIAQGLAIYCLLAGLKILPRKIGVLRYWMWAAFFFWSITVFFGVGTYIVYYTGAPTESAVISEHSAQEADEPESTNTETVSEHVADEATNDSASDEVAEHAADESSTDGSSDSASDEVAEHAADESVAQPSADDATDDEHAADESSTDGSSDSASDEVAEHAADESVVQPSADDATDDVTTEHAADESSTDDTSDEISEHAADEATNDSASDEVAEHAADEAVAEEVAEQPAVEQSEFTGDVAVSEWVQLQPTNEGPSPRYEHAMYYHQPSQQTFLFGGRNGGEAYNDVWVLDMSTLTWREIGADSAVKPQERYSTQIIVDEGGQFLYVATGHTAARANLNDVWQLDLNSGQWTDLSGNAGTPPEVRYGGPGGNIGDNLVVTHGFGSTRYDDTWQFNTSTAQWENITPANGVLPLKRCLFAATPLEGDLAVHGGCAAPFGPCHLDDTWILDSETNEWREVQSDFKPVGRQYQSLVADANRLILFGGQDAGSNLLNDLWYLDTVSGEWVAGEASGPSARYQHAGLWIPERNGMLIFGGRDGSGALNDLWQLNVVPQ